MRGKRRVILIALLAMAILSSAWVSAQEESPGDHAGPAVIAVKFHADWCGYCKAMGSVFEELQAKFDTQPVLFVTLDHTREYNRVQSAFLAQSLGLGEVWAEHGNRTGFILLVDGKSREVLSKLTHEQNLKEMGASLVDAVKQAS